MIPKEYPWAEEQGPRNGPRAFPNGYSVIRREATKHHGTYDTRLAWFAHLEGAEGMVAQVAAAGRYDLSILRDPDGAVIHLAKDLIGGAPYLRGEVAR